MIQRVVSLAVIVLVMFSGLVQGCAADHEIRLSIRGASVEQRVEIMEAPAVWNAVTYPQLHFVFDDEADDPRVLILVEDLSEERKTRPGLNGYWDGHNVHVEQSLEGDTMQMVTAHELGHALGIAHHDEPGLMNPSAGQITISPADLAGCVRARACP